MPALVMIIAAAYITWTSIESALRAQQTADLVAALEQQDNAGTAFAQERALTIAASAPCIPGQDPCTADEARGLLLQGVPETDDNGKVVKEDGEIVYALPSAQVQTNQALDERDAQFKSLDTSFLDPRVKAAIDQTIFDRAQVVEVQDKVRDQAIAEQQVTRAYNIFIEDSVDVMTQLADTTANRDLGERIRAHQLMDELMLTNTYERPLIGNLLTASAVAQRNGDTLDRAVVLRALEQITLGNIQFEDANIALEKIPGERQVPPMDGSLDTVRTLILQGNEQDLMQNTALAASFGTESATWVEEARVVRDQIREDALDLAEAQARDAFNTALITGGIAIGALAFSIITALVIARRLVSPLRRLTQAAGVVRDRLPTLVEQVSVPGQGPTMDLDPIHVESSDEIGQLAAAFNDVNRTTIEVAREQAALRGSIAEMFVNVARRDQVLLNRQLAFLDDLERSEEDPTTLSNLFRLDHLATRMRRNAESLLVLAGIDSGRRVRQPMPVSDVIRTASSEIELYDRVRLNLVTDPMMLGHNALNAAHLLAELLENATMFSEPHTPVEVTTERTEDFVSVTVRDHGLGMTPEEIAEANSKVASHAASDAVGAQRLGLFVVGRLADRLGATVEFATGTESTGTIVTVRFPSVLFLPDNSLPLPQPTDPLEATTQAAAARVGGMPDGSGAPTPPVAPAAPGTTSFPMAGGPESGRVGPRRPQVGAPTGSLASSPPAMPEPPAAVPVDLDALTDGTTALGMPRRRQSTPTAGMQTTPTGSIVLPEIQTPTMPDISPDETGWTPPQDVSAGNSLPSRASAKKKQEEAEAAAAAPVFEETTPAPVNVDQRSALFSSFRSMNTIDGAESQSLQLDPVTQDPASLPGGPDTDIMRFPAAAGVRPPTSGIPQQRPMTSSQPQVRPGHVPSSAGFGAQPLGDSDDGRYEALPAFEELMQDLPSRRSVRETKPAGKRGLFGRKPGQPATGELRAYQPDVQPDAQPALASRAPISSVPQASVAPQAAPAPSATANRTPRTDFGPSDFGPADFAPAPAASAPPAPAPAAPAPPAPAPAAQEEPYQRGYQEGYKRALEETRAHSVIDAETSAVPRTAVPAPTPATSPVDPRASQASVPLVGAPATEAVPLPPADATRPPAASAAPAPMAPAPALAVENHSPLASPSSGDIEFRDPYPTGAVYDPSSYGEPASLTRRTPGSDSDGTNPLDREYVRDSVEARSEWVASATLYEEMTSLLNRGAYQEDDVSDSYRPETVSTVSDGTSTGLTRRTRGASGTGADPAVEKHSARIERDPEQLRSRLSAFQSATVRGRDEAVDQSGTEHNPGNKDDEGGSTWSPSTMNDVPDSAPQPR
ncbi:ATP-binding protein [Myceligenerans pegani]|uniref:histidine kinase n=1 Tax=Myceligenerans pegani TaxID=2776917 RepID=A0ABR9MT23_9MICO|nr:ATP-binding protein [Myceligenerans sp. TRM 65318]MBE1874176.1 HAMP domain-containing protein [Myceligenerans sp. TRM 65318]MBE3016448.1 HAMP domain-containing protein [Myceligenerans sp. TRM 65318]